MIRRRIYSARGGKYQVSWEKYERYYSGGVRTASFFATSDIQALKKIAERLLLYVDSEQIDPDPEDFEYLMNEYGKIYTDVDSAIQAMTDSDGADFILYIKRPDGSYLYDSGVSAEEEEW